MCRIASYPRGPKSSSSGAVSKAGLVSQLWPTPTLTELTKYSHELYASLEAETGQASGYRKIGSISLARTEERLEELKRTSSMVPVFGVESEFIDNNRLQELYPGISTDGIIGAMYIENDGQTNPIDTTMALARGAGNRGVKIIENCKVTEIVSESGVAVGVKTASGDIRADKVILAAGLAKQAFAPSYVASRIPEALGHSYDMHWPFYQLLSLDNCS
ncbi:MAG: FAD-dependent oxidoreductase [Gammaproteobacteria bacterium]|nr:FAD-dependent oxidoreductase [Gammaproteobacteria bacterium]